MRYHAPLADAIDHPDDLLLILTISLRTASALDPDLERRPRPSVPHPTAERLDLAFTRRSESAEKDMRADAVVYNSCTCIHGTRRAGESIRPATKMRSLACVIIALSTRWATALFAVAAVIGCFVSRPRRSSSRSTRPSTPTSGSHRDEDEARVLQPGGRRRACEAASPGSTPARSRSPSCAARSSCSISGRSAASIAITSSPTWPSSKKNIRMSLSSSASIPASLTPSATPRTSAARSREYRIKHPVINDARMTLWNRFGVNSWPTIVLIDSQGNSGRRGPAARATMTCLTARSASSSRPPGSEAT